MFGTTYEELPSSVREIVLSKEKWRKFRLFVQWALIAVAIVCSVVSGIANAAKGEGEAAGVSFALIIVFVMLISAISGLDHLGFMFKKAVKNGIGLIIILGLWYIVVFAGIIALALYSGWVFLIIDSILFLLKKPLISQKQITRIINSEKVQSELLAQAYAGANEPSASDKLAELKEMLDSGLITAEEFNAKKSELLNNL